MTAVCVRTQEELDAALANPEYAYHTHEIIIDPPAGVWLTLDDSCGKDVIAGDRATVVVGGRATVEARGRATVEARGRATVVARGRATVVARDRATVEARGRATVEAGAYVAIRIISRTVTHQGGIVIDMTAVDQTNPATWCAMHLVEIDEDGQAHLFKAVDDDLNAGHLYRLTRYPIGEVVDDGDNWRDDNTCGGGLHASPTPRMAKTHYETASRFLEVRCPVAELRPIDESKAKAPRLHVLREVTLDGTPVEGGEGK